MPRWARKPPSALPTAPAPTKTYRVILFSRGPPSSTDVLVDTRSGACRFGSTDGLDEDADSGAEQVVHGVDDDARPDRPAATEQLGVDHADVHRGNRREVGAV